MADGIRFGKDYMNRLYRDPANRLHYRCQCGKVTEVPTSANDYVPLSVRHGNRRAHRAWKRKLLKERVALWLAPWLRAALPLASGERALTPARSCESTDTGTWGACQDAPRSPGARA